MGDFTYDQDEVLQVLRSGAARESLLEIGDKIATEAGQIASREAKRTGDYAGSFEARPSSRGSLLAAEVGSTDFKAVWIEEGTKRNRPIATLQRAAENVTGKRPRQTGGSA